MAGRITLIGLLIVCVVAGCGGGGSSLSTVPGEQNRTTPTGAPAPSLNELQSALQAEFDRLGIDPSKVTAAAPRGATNGVFDLAAELIDPDGAGGDPPTGIVLAWTERLQGDYSQDGMVTVADLTPIAVYWEQIIGHEQPGLHGGIEYWPDGDPDGTGALNWRLARADGNDNGLIGMADISTIAQHWQEQLSGYRVYRRAPGESEFTRLPHPFNAASKLTVARPTETAANAPVRYSFIDVPPGMGEYEYYVIGWSELTGHSSSEAETPSNHVTATMDVSLTDTTPPVWDDTVGITNATDNGYGTVTIEWETATDIAVPPAPASPPVSYNVYYSTISPIDFAGAMKVSGQTGTTWTSGKLVVEQEYFFAVRVQDSATPVNEDENTNELGVTVTDTVPPVPDWDPPVWTEVHSYARPGETEKDWTVEGIRELTVGDGRINITCADAMDELSPPVHYDLYYLDLSKELSYDRDIMSNDNVEIIQDIPKEYEFVWPNRKRVYLCVRARDSSATENLTLNRWGMATAPSNLRRIPIDMHVPGLDQIDPGRFMDVKGSGKFDRHTKTKYIYYYYRMQDNVEPAGTIWVLALDMQTGQWTTDLELTFNEGQPEISRSIHFSINQIGEVWFRVWVSDGPDSYAQFYHRFGPDDWRVWDPPDIQGEWEGDFDHNNLPVFYELLDSDVNPGKQLKLHYRWWDEAAQEWHSEFVCDPGGLMTYSTVRPDGVIQLCTSDAYLDSSPTPDLFAHLLERSPDGTWIEILHELGRISGCYTNAYWGEEWAWCGSINDHPQQPGQADKRSLAYGNKGYTSIGYDDYLVAESGRPGLPGWPADGGGYHSPPELIFHNGEIVQSTISQAGYTYNKPSIDTYVSYVPRGINGFGLDKKTGWYATIGRCSDKLTANIQCYLFVCDPGDSIYELDW